MSSLMSNPHVWLIGFVLTAIGAGPGLTRIFKFLKMSSFAFFYGSYTRSIEQAVDSAIEHLKDNPQGMDGVISFYFSRTSDLILKSIAFIFNFSCGIYVIKFGFSPFSENESFKFLAILFAILSLVNLIEIWIVRFEFYIFRRALPKIRQKLTSE